MRVSFIGHPDGGELRLPGGPTVRVAHGQVVSVPDEVGRSLLEQPSNWQKESDYGESPEAKLRISGGVSPSNLAERALRDRRAQLGLTQGEVAARLAEAGYPLRADDVSRIEAPRRKRR